ncbi:MAG: xanthine dehydrogenase accessory protein XdhC [Halobacteriovoraceae bacterium]|nr:xanthine dehydrogenase accessory protein XdhC [Halobacteriovoraceae bacterium]
MTKLNNFLEAYAHYTKQNKSFVVVTLTKVAGSAPQDLGARMFVDRDGLLWGTVGGGKVEAHCIQYAQNMLENQTTLASETWNLQKDIGMTCGGAVSFLFENETTEHDFNIAIFGAGHVAQSLATILATLSCQAVFIDHREDWLKRISQSKNIKTLLISEMAEAVENLPENSFVLSMTMGHAYDVPILAKALKKEFPYVGVIGSKSKRNAILKDLQKSGLSDLELEKLICPIGEPIGSNDPSEIAISIVAQLLKLRDQVKH